MDYVVLVPGIMGSELVDGRNRKVWPPKLREMAFGYGRIRELMGDDVRPSGILRNVSLYGVYESLIDDIERCGYTTNGLERRFVPFPYDWRKSNADSAAMLAATLDSLTDVGEITVLAHSMGGLVCRFLLESGQFNGRPWFDRIATLVTMGTPHAGAPKSLSQILGHEEVLGVSGADMRTLANDLRYPSGYELIPPAGAALLLTAPRRGRLPTGVDPFDPAVVQGLGLNPGNVQAAKAFWSKLDLAARPATVAYYFFVGSAHTTHVRHEWDTVDLDRIDRKDSGDGTVPISSAIATGVPHGFAMKKHLKIFGDRDLRRALYDILDAPAGIEPQDASAAAPVGAPDAFGLSVGQDTYAPGDPIEIVVSYNRPIDSPDEAFEIVAIDPDTEAPLAHPRPVAFNAAFDGTQMTSFSLIVTPDLEQGMYELVAGREVDDPDRTFFFVTERRPPSAGDGS